MAEELTNVFWGAYWVAGRYVKRDLMKRFNNGEFENLSDGIARNAHWRVKVKAIRELCR